MIPAAVLCGGASTRLGRHKILEPVAGSPSGRRIIHACRKAGLGPILAVTGAGGPSMGELQALGFDAVLDDSGIRPAQSSGPLCGIIAALRLTQSRTLFVPGDHPAMPPGLMSLVASSAAPAISLPDNPLFCAIDHTLLRIAEARVDDGKTGVRGFLAEVGARCVGQGALWMCDPFGGRKLGFNTTEQLHDVTFALQGSHHASGLLWALGPGQQAPQQRGPLCPG